MADTPWARAHRRYVTIMVGSIVTIFLIGYFAIGLYRPPNCFDRDQNNDEVGVDCGGACELYCQSQTGTMRLVWSRVFEVSPEVYNAVAYLENPDFDKRVDALGYRFTVYDREGRILATREGAIDIRREPIVGVFESRITIRGGDPYRTSFEWLGDPVWKKASVERRIEVSDEAFVPAQFGTELAAKVLNKEPVPLRDVEVVVIVYDPDGNAISATKTYIDLLGPREERRVSFVWSNELPTQKGRIEFIPRIPQQ